MEQAPIAAGSLEASVGRMAGKCTKPLSYRQRDVLSKAPAEWGRLPPGIGCTNATLEALEKRGLVETRYCAEGGFVYEGRQHFGWQWRKTPNANVTGLAPGKGDK